MRTGLVFSLSLAASLLSACVVAPVAPVLVSQPALPSYAATECGRNIVSTGDPRNGATLATFVKLQNLDTRSAIGQVEKLAMDQGMQIGADQVSAASGRVTIIVKDPAGGHDYPMVADAQRSSGRLTIAAQLMKGQIVNPEVMRDRMCNVISKVKMDAAGASIAVATQRSLGSGQIVNIKAVDLANEVAELLRQKQDAVDIEMKYTGKVYRIDGQVMQPGSGLSIATAQTLSFAYITEVHAGLLGIGPMIPTKVQIECKALPSQYLRFLNLGNRDYATLIAKVTGFSGKGRPKSMFVDNPLTTTGSVFADPSIGGVLYADCSFEQ